jgi:hypothetical protein
MKPIASLMVLIVLVGAGTAHGGGTGQGSTDYAVEGVLSLTPVLEHGYMAVELPLGPGEGVAGVRWFNNDAGAAFPRVALVGSEDGAPSLQAAFAEAISVAGATSGWSEVRFEQPVAGGLGPLYAVFQLPAFQERTAEGTGGGPGLGFRHADGGPGAYLSPDGEDWVGLAAGVQLAVEPIKAAMSSGMGTQSAKAGAVPGTAVQPEAPRYETALESVSPNPGNPAVAVAFTLRNPGPVRVTVYNLRGQLVRTLVSSQLAAGPHMVDWKGTDETGEAVASGVYVVRLEADRRVMERSVALVR